MSLPIYPTSVFSLSEQPSLCTLAQIMPLLRNSRHYTETVSILFRDKICLLGMQAGNSATDPQNIKICQTWVGLRCKSERLFLCLCTAPPAPLHLEHHSLTAVLCRERYRTALLPPLLTRCYSGPQWIYLPSECQG